MAICRFCEHHCPDDEGEIYCQRCLLKYLAYLEEIEKAARRVFDCKPVDTQYLPTRLQEALKKLDIAIIQMDYRDGKKQAE